MSPHPQTIFISSSRDMTGWAALTAECVRDFAGRYGLSELRVLDYRDIDPADVNHVASWQDNIGSPSELGVALTIVLFGERVGTPLPSDFRPRQQISEKLRRAGHDWIWVPGVDPEPMPE